MKNIKNLSAREKRNPNFENVRTALWTSSCTLFFSFKKKFNSKSVPWPLNSKKKKFT